MIDILAICVKDFFSRRFLLMSILPFTMSLLLFGWLLFGFGSNASQEIILFVNNIKFVQNNEFLSQICTSNIFAKIVVLLFYTFGAFLSLMLGVICAAVISGFLTDSVVKFVNQKYYNLQIQNKVSNLRLVWIYFGILIKFSLLFLLSLLLFFIPILNLILLNVAFFYLFYKFMLVDVASCSQDRDHFELTLKTGAGFWFNISALCFYLACLIPLVGLFFQLFFIMFFSHLIFKNSVGLFS
nr:EI24 domain-containing protein [Campylobacter sp.]